MSIRYVNFLKKYPQSACWQSWFSVHRYYGGRMFHFHIRHHALIFDFR